MLVFVFSHYCDVKSVDAGHNVTICHDLTEITISMVDAFACGLFLEAARNVNAIVYPVNQSWRAVPAYRWYGQLIARHDYMAYRIEGRYARIAKCVPHVE